MSGVESNILKMYWLRFFTSFWLIVPVLIPFYEANGLSASQVFIIQSIFNLAVMLLEIPTGYVSDIVGRRRAIIIASFALPAGLAIYAFSHNFWAFAAAEIVLAIGWGLRSGTDSALVYETLLKMKRKNDFRRFEGKAAFFERLGDATASILGGLIALISLTMPFYVNIVTSMALIPISFMLLEPKRANVINHDHLKEMINAVKFAINHPKVGPLMLYFSVIFAVSITGVWTYYFYYRSLGLSVAWFGIIHAGFGLLSGLGSMQAHKIEATIGRKTTLYTMLIIGMNLILLGLVKSVFMIPFILLNGFLLGLAWPLLNDYINKLVKSNIRATVLSTASMGKGLLFAIFATSFGFVTDHWTLGKAFLSMGGAYLAASAVILWLLNRNKAI